MTNIGYKTHLKWPSQFSRLCCSALHLAPTVITSSALNLAPTVITSSLHTAGNFLGTKSRHSPSLLQYKHSPLPVFTATRHCLFMIHFSSKVQPCAEAQIRFQLNRCGMCGWHSDTGTQFYPTTTLSPFAQHSILIHRRYKILATPKVVKQTTKIPYAHYVHIYQVASTAMSVSLVNFSHLSQDSRQIQECNNRVS